MNRTSFARPNLKKCRDTGKVRFRDHKEAVKARHIAANARLDEIRAGVPLESIRRRERRDYACPDCGGNHLTSWQAWGQPA